MEQIYGMRQFRVVHDEFWRSTSRGYSSYEIQSGLGIYEKFGQINLAII